MAGADKTRQKAAALIEGVLVELGPVGELRHACDPTLCRGRLSCCAEYEVRVTQDEISRLVGLMPRASEFAPALAPDGRLENVFEGLGHEVCALETDEEGLCAFAYSDAAGAWLCSLHSAASALDLDPYAAKPEACTLWPLAIVETRPTVLSVQPGAYGFPCNSRRAAPFADLDPGVRQIIAVLYGSAFADKLEEAIREWAGQGG